MAANPITLDAESAIHELAQQYEAHSNARRFDDITSLFAEDGSLLVPNHKVACGRAEIRTVLQEMFQTFDPRNIKIETRQYEYSRDVAFSIGISTSSVKLPDGTRFDDRSKWVAAMRNQKGEWKLVALIFNSDLPAAR